MELRRPLNSELLTSLLTYTGHIYAIYADAPTICKAPPPCVKFLMRADTLRGKVGGGWALKIESFLSPVKWHRADRRVPLGAQKFWPSFRDIQCYFTLPFIRNQQEIVKCVKGRSGP